MDDLTPAYLGARLARMRLQLGQSRREDITQRRRAEDHLEERARQRAAIADLGRAALAGRDFRDLAADAARLITVGDDIDSVRVHELTPEGSLVAAAPKAKQARDGHTLHYHGCYYRVCSAEKRQSGRANHHQRTNRIHPRCIRGRRDNCASARAQR